MDPGVLSLLQTGLFWEDFIKNDRRDRPREVGFLFIQVCMNNENNNSFQLFIIGISYCFCRH